MNTSAPPKQPAFNPQKTRPVGLHGMFGPNERETQAFANLMQEMGWDFHADLQTGEFILVQGSNWDKVCRSKSKTKKGAIRELLEEALLEHTIMFDPLKKAALIRGPLNRGYDEATAKTAEEEKDKKEKNPAKKSDSVKAGGGGSDKQSSVATPHEEAEIGEKTPEQITQQTEDEDPFELTEEDFLAEKSDMTAFEAMPSDMKSAIRRAHKAGLTIRLDQNVLYIAKISRDINDIARQQAAKVNTLMKAINLENASEQQLKMLAQELNKLCAAIEALNKLDDIQKEEQPEPEEDKQTAAAEAEPTPQDMETPPAQPVEEEPETDDAESDSAEEPKEPEETPDQQPADEVVPPAVLTNEETPEQANEAEMEEETAEAEEDKEAQEPETEASPAEEPEAEADQPDETEDIETTEQEEPEPEDIEAEDEAVIIQEEDEEPDVIEEPEEGAPEETTVKDEEVAVEEYPITEPEQDAVTPEPEARETAETVDIEQEEIEDVVSDSTDGESAQEKPEEPIEAGRAEELDDVLTDVADFEVPEEARYKPTDDEVEEQLVLGDAYEASKPHIQTRASTTKEDKPEVKTGQIAPPPMPQPQAQLKPKPNTPTAAERYEETHQFEEAVEREDLDDKLKKELLKAKQAGYEAKIIGPKDDPDAERRLVVYKDEKDANGKPVSRAIFAQKFDDLEEPSELERGLARLRQAISTDPDKNADEKAQESDFFEKKALSEMELFDPDKKPEEEEKGKEDKPEPDQDDDLEEDEDKEKPQTKSLLNEPEEEKDKSDGLIDHIHT